METNIEQEWEEEFDSLYGDLDYPICCTQPSDCACNGETVKSNMKLFISNLLATQRTQILGEVGEVVRKERETWARESIGDKALQSLEMALSRQLTK